MSSKGLFDAIRKMLGRGMTQAEVDAINANLDACATPDAPSEPEQSGAPTAISAEGTALIHQFEGCAKLRPDGNLEAYPDPGTGGAPWTIGWGATGAGITKGTIWTRQQADDWFAKHIKRYAAEVVQALGPSIERTSQAQFDALVSFHYNTGAIARATLTAKHRAGDFAGAAAEFAKWNRAGGRVLGGLVRRRAAEAELYRRGS